MKNAAIYARVSSAQQKEEHTIASQTAALIAFAQEHGYHVPREWIFEDEGFSGANLQPAPCFAGINTVRKVAPTGISPLGAREFVRGFPGLRCFGVACSLSGNGSARHEREIQQKKTEIGASAADGGRPRLLYAVDNINKPLDARSSAF